MFALNVSESWLQLPPLSFPTVVSKGLLRFGMGPYDPGIVAHSCS